MRTGRALLTTLAAASLVVPTLTSSSPVNARAYPGKNGRILFTSDRVGGQLDLHTMTPAGGSVINISNDPGSDEYAAFSPNGKRVVVTTSRDGNYELYVMRADGSSPTRITNDPGTDATPAWSPNGKRIVFASNRDGDFELYSITPAGADIKQLTNNTATDTNEMLDAFPDFSPNGEKIVFASERDGNLEVYTMNANGSTQANITTDAGDDYFPAWSPDGKKIAFSSNRDGDLEIFVMNPNGTGLSQLTVNNPATDAFPVWSPEGNKIAFGSDRDDPSGSGDVIVMNANGSGAVNLTETLDVADIPFDWQPTPANRSLSIRRSRASVDRGERVRLFGELDGVASCIGNQKIQLQSRPLNGGSFSTIDSTRTDADGDYELQKRVRASKQYRSVAPAFGLCKKAVSPNTSVSVQGSSASLATQPVDEDSGGLALGDLLPVLSNGK